MNKKSKKSLKSIFSKKENEPKENWLPRTKKPEPSAKPKKGEEPGSELNKNV